MDINKKVLNEVSKGAKMGMDAIKFVSDKVSDSRFQRVLNVEYLKYKEIFNRVGNIYHNYDLTDDPQETNIMNKAMTWYGIQMNTMTEVILIFLNYCYKVLIWELLKVADC